VVVCAALGLLSLLIGPCLHLAPNSSIPHVSRALSELTPPAPPLPFIQTNSWISLVKLASAPLQGCPDILPSGRVSTSLAVALHRVHYCCSHIRASLHQHCNKNISHA
jgi:hypothetical protein